MEVAERFGRGESDGWRGEEIDIRDNQVPKVRKSLMIISRATDVCGPGALLLQLPPVLGLLQLDVLLVEGNA